MLVPSTTHRNRRGNNVFDGQVLSTPRDGHDYRIGADDEEHQRMLRHFEPSFDTAIRESIAEIAEMRMAGTLRPFVEGEAIGAAPAPKKPKKHTAKELKQYQDQRRQWQREEMLALRRKNDEAIRELLNDRY